MALLLLYCSIFMPWISHGYDRSKTFGSQRLKLNWFGRGSFSDMLLIIVVSAPVALLLTAVKPLIVCALAQLLDRRA